MPAISKFLDDSVVLQASEGLKELGKSAVISRKLQAIISARTHGIEYSLRPLFRHFALLGDLRK